MDEPKTREEMFLAGVAGSELSLPAPVTREELFLAKAAGMDVETPEPITRKEKYLAAIQGGGGAGDFEQYAASAEYVSGNKMSDEDYDEIYNADMICALATQTYSGEAVQLKAPLVTLGTSTQQQALFKTPRNSSTNYIDIKIQKASPHSLSGFSAKKNGNTFYIGKIQFLYYRLK